MPRPAATKEQRDEKRERIRRAAAEIYQEGGVTKLSVRAVAARAGVSTGLLYRYFDNMSELLRTLWIRPVIEFGKRVEEVIETESDPIARIKKVLTTYVAWVSANPDVHRGVLMFVRPDPDHGFPLQDPNELAMFRALRSAVVDGQATGQVRSGDPTPMTEVLWAGIHGALALPVNLDRYHITPADELARSMITTLIESLEPRPGEGQVAEPRLGDLEVAGAGPGPPPFDRPGQDQVFELREPI